MKAKAETSAVLYTDVITPYSSIVNLEGGVKQRKDLKTVTDNLKLILISNLFSIH